MKFLIIILFLIITEISVYAGSVTLAYDPSPDPITSYTIFYGTNSVLTNPSTPIPVGRALQFTITNLTIGQKYYFAVKAYYYNNESGFSNEISYTIPDNGTSTTTIGSPPTPPTELKLTDN